jgi:2-C-methyl-D-erythritol 4-phosphate cytidylyltransferase / 2-C-methyl-D-erythritol 2,4-cyclodiphosphate synthase
MAKAQKNREFHVIVAAAGQGSRMGAYLPKQYIKIAGKTLLAHTLQNIMSWQGVCSVQVVIDPEHADLYHEAVSGLGLPPPITGGKQRKNSINNALNNVSHLKNEDIVLVHDAARPFTRPEDVQNLLSALDTHRAASLASPVSDTLRRDQQVIDRTGLWALQTPQAFHYGDLKQAHASESDAHTDDTSLLSAMGINVKIVPGSRTNFKITETEDLVMAEALLNRNTETRTGFGYDVHAFEKAPTRRKLMLCGVAIPHQVSLEGHSDADVGLHALTDAILGAIGAGDIGHHFPPSDMQFKNMDSAVFLEKSVDMLADKGGTILNLDVTLICEAPKIGPHRDAMVARIAQIARIDASRVNVKATTTEKLGFTGRGEGIAAQAVATVRLRVS